MIELRHVLDLADGALVLAHSNDLELAERLLGVGADGIITTDPRIFATKT